MKQRAYQGQSGETGFDPIAVGYGVLEKQRQRDDEVIRDLDNQREQSQRVNEKYISDLDRTFTREEQNRKELKALEDRTLDVREAAIDANQQTRNRNFTAKSKTIDNELKAFEGLAKFSQTLGEEITKYQDAKNQADMEDEYSKALAEGLPSDRVASTLEMEDQLKQAGDVTESIADGFAARGVSPEVVMQVRSGNKWRDYGRLKAYAEMAGRSYGPWLEQSLAQMGPEAATPQGRAAAVQQLQMQYLQQNGLYGLSADFLGPMFAEMRTSSNGVMEAARKNQVIQQSQTLIDDAKTALYVNRTPQSVLDLYNANATAYGPDGKTIQGRAAGRDAVFAEFENLNRYKSDTEVMRLLEDTITDNGKSLAKRFPGMVDDLLQKRRVARNTENSLVAGEQREQGRQYVEGLMSEYFSTAESFTDKDLDAAINEGKSRGYDVSRLENLRYKTTESVNKEYWKDYLQKEWENGTITLDMINTADVPFDVRNVWTDRVTKLEAARKGAGGGVDVDAGIESALKFPLDALGVAKNLDPSYQGAYAYALQDYQRRFAKYSLVMDAQAASKEAYDEVIKNIQEGRGKYAVTPQGQSSSGRAMFGAFAPGADWAEKPQEIFSVVKDLEAKIKAGEDPLSEELQGGVSNSQLQIIKNQIQDGRPPRIPKQYMELGRLLGIDPREVLDKQFKAAGMVVPERIPTSVDRARESTVDPRLQELLMQPTAENQRTANLQASDYSSSSDNGQSLIAMAQRNGWDPGDLAAIFSFETGGTLDPSQPGYGAAAGRIGLIQGGPNERAAYGLGSGNWDQEMLAVERYLVARGAKPGMGIEDLYATINGGNPGAGNTPDGNGTVARSPETLSRLEEHRGQALMNLGIAPRAPGSASRDVNLMSPTLRHFYTTGGATNGGYSEHTDIKQYDNPNTVEDEWGQYFDPAELDEFIQFSDPEFGEITLSELRRRIPIEGGNYGDPRSYGPHAGWDYGTKDGTKLFLQNGARVVRYEPVQGNGTRAIIKLPDGRFFAFLHGKGV